MDEGMVKCGLEAAAARLPFLPIRAGLGSDVRNFWGDELKTVTSPYPEADGRSETLIAMPALNLDASFVHLNLGDKHGNAAYNGVDPYFDDLYCMAAEKRYVSVERIVETEELVKSVPLQNLLLNRMMVDAVVEAPNGAHFTLAGESYGRDEKFQRHYAEAAKTPESWQTFVDTFLSGSEEDYQAAVKKFADPFARHQEFRRFLGEHTRGSFDEPAIGDQRKRIVGERSQIDRAPRTTFHRRASYRGPVRSRWTRTAHPRGCSGRVQTGGSSRPRAGTPSSSSRVGPERAA